ncbi:MAG: Gfo/Idh/MocA family oxidoreductase [Chloroflexi bacterium]|nr:Gfo/Idh/MocA family oxidoreductase [Chloroflexota bacterium]
MNKLKLAIVGCGAITQGIHLPVTALSNQVEVTVLVDKFLPRAHELADKYGVPVVADEYREIIGKADAAIVSLPNYLHAPVTIDLLQHEVHVLVEKPMALKTSNCDEMIEAASNTGAVLAVGLVRRFYGSSQFVKQIVENGLLGNILGFDLREGIIFRWAVASDSMFRKEAAGGGVLVDIGPHALDLLLWWLGGYTSVEYYDDAMGGVEADCELHLRLQCGASGVVELSRTRNLRNSWIIRGERGTLEVGTGFNPLIRLKTKNRDVVLAGRVARDGVADKTIQDVFRRQFDDFVDAILSHREPFVPGQEGRRAVELVETCYALRQPSKQPWMFLEGPRHGALESALP